MSKIVLLALGALLVPFVPSHGAEPIRVFISVDMEGIGGIGTLAMVLGGQKDYEKGRDFMTAEVNAVTEAIFSRGPAEIIVNDSHGSHQNLHHERLDPRVTYIQGDDKPFGMVQGLDESIDCAVFLGYHTRAGSKGFLAHTGTFRVTKITLNGIEVGEGGLNAAFAGSLGVPVVLVSGDRNATEELTAQFSTRFVVTKDAVSWGAAQLRHPSKVREDLSSEMQSALGDLERAKPWRISEPVTYQIEFSSPKYADALELITNVSRIDGSTIAYTAENMSEAYKMIRFMYKYVEPE